MEKYNETSQQEGKSKGLGLGLGLDLGVNLDLSGVRGLVNTLTDALAQTGQVATDQLVKVIETVRAMGVDKLVQWAKEGGEEAKNAYNQLVGHLQEAAARGEDQARDLLNSMGENVESAGEKMQETASKEDRPMH